MVFNPERGNIIPIWTLEKFIWTDNALPKAAVTFEGNIQIRNQPVIIDLPFKFQDHRDHHRVGRMLHAKPGKINIV
jgi:hypothetical protein